MKKIKVKKHYEILAVDNYFCIDGAFIIHKDYVQLDNPILDQLLREHTSARWNDTTQQVLEIEKPSNWTGIVPSYKDDNYLPMLETGLFFEMNKVKYQILKNDTDEKLELQAINGVWLKEYLPSNNIYYNSNRTQFTVWDKDELIALIMPCSMNRVFITNMKDEINRYRQLEKIKIGA